MQPEKKRFHLTTFQTITLSFLLLILIGSLLLTLPFASTAAGSAGFFDALFTATSAVCVTGLVVVDTATAWTGFGQAVLLLLIQIGGMGVVTMALCIAMLSGRRIGLAQRSVLQEAIAAPYVGGIVKLTGFILKTMLLLELLGAALLAPAFTREFGLGRGLWYALFHSVSAFCNAGFDLMGAGAPFSSMTAYAAAPLVNVTLMLLIVIGGIGFLVWNDVKTNGLRLRRYCLQSKVALTASGVLILLPAVYLFFCEFADMPLPARAWASLFQSVTTRTAGFNSVDLGRMSEAGQAIFVVLMLIGGSPGSTAGGMKTTTLAVLLATLVAIIRRNADPHLFKRRVAAETVRYAASILLLYLLLFLFGGILISALEGLPVLDCLFETASAIGTVGLTLGLTPSLGAASRVVLIVLMFCGRVGALTLVFSAQSGAQYNASKLPQERITVG